MVNCTGREIRKRNFSHKILKKDDNKMDHGGEFNGGCQFRDCVIISSRPAKTKQTTGTKHYVLMFKIKNLYKR